jgi:hypothetical protein
MLTGWSLDRYLDPRPYRRRNYDEFTLEHLASSGVGIERIWIVFDPILPDLSVHLKNNPMDIISTRDFSSVRVMQFERPKQPVATQPAN